MYAATGESAMPTWARPLESARFAWFWSLKADTLTLGLPALLHFLFWAVASACCVVPFSTATVLPQRDEMPPTKYVTKSTFFCRAFVSVKDDIPTPYLPDASPGMIVANVPLTTLKFSPRTVPSAFARSASTPTMVFPLDAKNSMGAYVASVATVSVPLLRILDGTSLAIFGCFVTCVVALDAPAKPTTTSARAAAPRSSPVKRPDISEPPIHDLDQRDA